MSVATVHSERHGADLHLGKNDPKPLINDAVRMDDVVRILRQSGVSLPALSAFDHSTKLPNGPITTGGWGMGGNGPQDDNSVPDEDTAAKQGAGNCAIAGPGHEHEEEHVLSGNPGQVTFSCWRDLQNYTEYTAHANGTGYDPITGSGDTGCDVSGVVAYRQNVGLTDDQGVVHTLGKSIQLEPGDLQHLWLASMLFQKVGFGINFRSNNMTEFDAGQPWTYDPSASDEGGHYIFNCGYVLAGGPMGRLISWGEAVPFTRSFYVRQCDEAISYVSTDMYSLTTGQDSDGYADQDLELYLTSFASKFEAFNAGQDVHHDWLRRLLHHFA